MNARLIASLLVSIALTAGCGDDSSGGGGSGEGGSGGDPGSGGDGTGGAPISEGGAATGGGDASAPTVKLGIASEIVAAGESVGATVTVTNFTLEPATGQPNEDGHGHYHVYLDDAPFQDYLVSDYRESISIPIPAGTPAGPHTLRISVAQNNHFAVNPAVVDIVDITVE